LNVLQRKSARSWKVAQESSDGWFNLEREVTKGVAEEAIWRKVPQMLFLLLQIRI